VILRDPGGGLGEEGLRVIKLMPKWIPGRQDGKPVRVEFTMPIKIYLAR
jgi:protein TonB